MTDDRSRGGAGSNDSVEPEAEREGAAEDVDYVGVATVHGPFQEAQIVSFLQSNGIAARTRGEAIRKIHGITVDGIGAAEVEVPARFAQMARELLAKADRGELQITDEFDEDSSAIDADD